MRIVTRFGRLLTGALPLLALGCMQRPPDGAGAGAGAGAPQNVTLLRCTPQPEAVAEVVVGPAGDTVFVRRNRLVIPAEALNGPTRFTVRERTDGYVGVDITSAVSRFRPPLQLTLSYAHCDALPVDPTRLKIYYVQGVHVMEELPSEVNPAAQTVTTLQLDHLSGYLLGGT